MTIRRSRHLRNAMTSQRRRSGRLDYECRRRLLLERLEDRLLLAVGPRLAGVQPNNSDLFSFVEQSTNVRDVAPRELTLRFDENQQIDPLSLSGIQIARSINDIFGDGDDQIITPGFIGVGKSPSENEVVIRFAESLSDAFYQIQVFGAGDANDLKNLLGDSYIPTLVDGDGNSSVDSIRFELDLGAQVVAVVPQPISRDPSGTLVQARNQIEVYFNDDDLFVENDDLGNPIQSSAENPVFYQLIFTADTVRNTDDVVIKPTDVFYDASRDLVTLTFPQNLDSLEDPDTGALIGPGTFRLRVGSDEAAPLPPQQFSSHFEVSSDFNSNDQVVLQFTAVRPDEHPISVVVNRSDLGAAVDSAPRLLINVVNSTVFVDLNLHAGEETTAQEVIDAINGHPAARELIGASINSGDPATTVGDRPVNYSPLNLIGLGSSFNTATNLTDETDIGAAIVVTGSGNAFVDGQFFGITDASGTPRTFEFDSDVPTALNNAASIAIAFSQDATQSQLGLAIVEAINGTSFDTTAILAGNRILLEGEDIVDMNAGVSGLTKEFQNRFDTGQVLEVSLAGDSFTEGQLFSITDRFGVTKALEFRHGFILQVPLVIASGLADTDTFSIEDENNTTIVFEFEDVTVLNGVTAPNVEIQFDSTVDTQQDVVNAVMAAIQMEVDALAISGITPFDLGEGRIHLGSTPVAVDTSGGGLTDTGSPLVQTPGATRIDYLPHASFTSNAVALAIGNAINAAGFATEALPVSNQIRLTNDKSIDVDLPGLAISTQGRFDTGPVLTVTKGGSGFDDGQTIQIRDDRGTIRNFEFDNEFFLTVSSAMLPNDGDTITLTHRATTGAVPTDVFVFEFVDTGSGGALNNANNVAVDFDSGTDGQAEIAAAIVAAFDGLIADGRLSGISLVDTGNGQIQLGAGPGYGFVITSAAVGQTGPSLIDPNAVAVTLTGGESINEMAVRLADAVNFAGFRGLGTAVKNRIYLTNDRQVIVDGDLDAITKSSQGIIISSAINPQPFELDFPGANNEPGHRDIPDEVGSGIQQHINADFADGGRDSTPGVTTVLYNFRDDYGVDQQGDALQNAITEQQKARAREAFQLWGNYLGVQFLESAREGLALATGDLNALDPTEPGVLNFAANDFRVRIDPRFASGLLVMDNGIQWNEDFGENWFVNSMVGIGAMLGLDLANDLPTSNVMALFTAPIDPITGDRVPFFNVGDLEPIYPGNADIIHGQHLYRPDGIDIDLYRFTIDLDEGRVGRFTAETFAQRLPNSSLLDTVVRLYRENPNGTRELIAQNDDYFSRDSLIEMDLGPGAYYIGISAGGNSDYDPTIEGTGIGGASQGVYDLRLNFRSQVEDENTIRDLDGQKTALDGDADGVTGGVYNFWFQTRPLNRVLEITDGGNSFLDGQVVTITNSQGVVKRFEFDSDTPPNFAAGNQPVSFTEFSGSVTLAQTLSTKIANAGFNVSATTDGTNRITLTGERLVSLSFGFVGIEIEGKTIFVDKTAGPNADGSLEKPFNSIARSGQTNAFAATHPDDIVRIVGNGGTDEDIDTLGDNFAYEIGFPPAGGPANLEDGTEMAVPRGVTVMIDPGTIFKMRRSRIGVGSSSLTVNRSGGALQVLGTPERNIFFTSWLNENIGRDSHPPTTSATRGDWGGIVFRADIDNGESRPSLENEGVFLNYVNHADISYGGGGNVVIGGIQQIVNPIQMTETRPTISFNRITNSADSAMSASPNSFDETNFHSPRFQAAGVFTSDYERIGPEIHSNFLLNNSTNGLFVRIDTPAGNALRPLTVSGRLDDTDIVHVLAENLVIQGSQGDPLLDLERPAVDLITFTPRIGDDLPEGVYNYKVTFVDANGFEGRPSTPTPDFAITEAAKTNGIGAIQLNQLPPVTGDFVSRRIYRTDANSDGVYHLVATLNASDTVFVDSLAPADLQDELRRDPPSGVAVTATPVPRGSLAVGKYNYRIVFVDAQGNEGASSDPFAELVNLGVGSEGGIRLDSLPATNGKFVSRRLYRSTIGGIAPYTLVAELDATTPDYIDDGSTLGGTLDTSAFGVIRARPHARLAIDPGAVIKLEGARIETKFGGQVIAEGNIGQEVVFTSRLDDAFGAGGTFDTNDDNDQPSGEASPSPGNWGGLFFGQLSRGSIDNALIAYGGGINRIEGTFTGFNVLEVHQADFRLTNSIIENNAEGVGGQGPIDRFGRDYNRVATVFVRGAQPIIVDNIFRDNNTLYDASKSSASLQMPVITINANSLIHDNLVDYGRSRGTVNVISRYGDNAGPLVRGNRLSNNAINAMVIRGEVLTTQSVWDDTGIVHVLTNQFDQRNARTVDAAGIRRTFAFDEIVIPEHHTYGGLRLESNSTESLVVKLRGSGRLDNSFNLIQNGNPSNRNPYDGAGFTASGRRFELDDRIGGTLHVVGQPGFPVVLTSFFDDTVGAGVQPDDRPQTDTNNDGIATIPRPNDWRSVRLDQESNDRNVEIALELESPEETAPGSNSTTNTAQSLGKLAANEQGGDENLRMGFEIQGFINEPNDVDIYSFEGAAGTEIWIDVDRTTFTLDTIVEFLDENGVVLARTDDTLREVDAVDFVSNQIQPNLVAPLQKSPTPYYPTHASGLSKDFFTFNPRDAGMRIALPGSAGARDTFHVRVRSKDGLTTGVYQLQIRTGEVDEFPGSTVRFADIRYANNGVEVLGLPKHSPLLGEAAEDELAGSFASNNNFFQDPVTPGNQPQDVGNLLASDRAAISIAGTTSSSEDLDFFKFDVTYEGISDASQHHFATTFDVDYADALVRYNSTLNVFDDSGRLILIGHDSNIAEDRSGPLADADLTDLSRGSVGPKDPYIGPVELPQGTYFPVVTSNGQISADLLGNRLLRLEPVNSVIRIAEDHIGSFGGSTAEDPVVPVLLDPNFVGSGTNLWHVTGNRAANPGHGLNEVFDLSRSGANLTDGGDSFYFGDESAGNTVPAGSMGNMLSNPFSLKGYSANDRPVLYFNHFIDNNSGQDAFRVSLVDAGGNATLVASSNTSDASSPAVTLLSQASGSDWLQARIELDTFAGSETLRLRFEYDGVSTGANEGAYIDDVIIGFAERGEMVTGAASNPNFTTDPNAPPAEILVGDYQLEIRKASEFGTSGQATSTIRSATVWGIQPGTRQIIQIDPANGAIVGQFPAPDPLAPGHLVAGLSIAEGGNSLIYVNGELDGSILYRLDPTNGTILSTELLPSAFPGDRGGLSYESPGTIFAVDGILGVDAQTGFGGLVTQHLSATFATPTIPGAMGGDDNGRQFLDAGALIVEYDPALANSIISSFPAQVSQMQGMAFDGTFLYVSDAAGNLVTLDPDTGTIHQTVAIPGGNLIGLAAARFNNANVGLTLTGSIDTNDREAQVTTLIAPAGTDVVDGQTFTVGDGVNELTFEFEDPEIGDGISGGHVEIRFKTSDNDPMNPMFLPDTDSVIATRIRDAINSPQAQTIINLRAAKSDGEVTGTASSDNRINLFGTALVDVPDSFEITETTNNANQLRDVIVGSAVESVGNATFVGSDVSAGLFRGGLETIGLESGIVLTTGDANFADDPNPVNTQSGRASEQGDADLDAEFGVTTADTTYLEFDFTLPPLPANPPMASNDLYLNFVFASEEYNESIGSAFADAVAIFVDEGADGIDVKNIALVPGMAPLDPVSIDTVNGGDPFDPSGLIGANPQFFNNNDPNQGGQFLDEFGYDGFTDVFVASLAGADALTTDGPHRIKIAISDVDDLSADSAVFIEAVSMQSFLTTDPDTGPFVRDPEGIASIRHEGQGDQNRFRDQGLVMIHSNTVTDSKTYGIVADAGERDTDGSFASNRDSGGTRSALDRVPVRLQSPVPGPVRNLVAPNNVPAAGGFTPSVTIANNTITSDGSLGGIHVSGNSQTFELTPRRPSVHPVQSLIEFTAGDEVCDGENFTIRAFGQSVRFEFEDISGSPVTECGSGVLAGNGWTQGSIPIFYRRSFSTGYFHRHPVIPGGRTLGYDQTEMAVAIKDAIDSSTLVSNDSTMVIQTYIAPSRSPGGFTPGPDPAVFVEHVSGIGSSPPGPGVLRIRRVGHAYAPQPFTRVVNNTVFGNDGDYSFFPDAAVEPNDTLFNAVDTRQGRQHYPETYARSATIGDTQNFRGDTSVDVDFYQFQLDIGDHVTIDLDAITNGSSLNPVLRLFDSVGEEIMRSVGLPAQNLDPFIDYTALAPDTYFVAVSGAGNDNYSPLSLGSRTDGASTGDYDIDINVRAPRTFVMTVPLGPAPGGTQIGDGTGFTIEDVTGAQTRFEFDSNGAVTPGSFAIAFNPTPIANNSPTHLAPELSVTIASQITASPLNNIQNLDNGMFGLANPLQQVTGEAYGSPQHITRWTMDLPTRAGVDSVRSHQRFVVVRNATKIFSNNSSVHITPVTDNDLDQLRQERGILVSEQATPTVLNNVLTNLCRGLEQVSFQSGNPGPADVGHSVPGGMVEGASVYQHNSISNSNIPFSNEDFQIALGGFESLYVNAADHNLFPADFALSIDSSIDSLSERDEFEPIKEALGISLSPILAPDRDVVGQLRVDDPNVQTPLGQGANVFKDRGSLDRSDFVGPAAALVFPQDNDADNLDLDGAVSIVQLEEGVYSNFTIQIVDGFEAADPFPGVGVDDDTLDGRVLPINEDGIPLLVRGPALTLFRDGIFLREGIDYTFRYNRTSNEAVLTPLSGIWQSGVYVIRVNNRDRFVVDADSGAAIVDGDDLKITNAIGETASIEFDSGYTSGITQTLGLQVPAIGAAIGGITDGQRFSITQDNGATTVVFEFDRNGNVLPDNRPVLFATADSASTLADSIVAAIMQAVTDGELSGLQPRNLGDGLVHVGATTDHEVDVTFSQLTTTVTQFPFSLTVPANGGLGLTDGETFKVSDGTITVEFEFDNDGILDTVPGPITCSYCSIPYLDLDSADQIASLLTSALANAPLGLSPLNVGGGVVELGAGANHSVDVTQGSLTRQMFIGGVKDGERFTITDGVTTVTFEFDNDGVFIDLDMDNVPDNTLLPFTTASTHLDLANQMVAAIADAGLGLDPIHVGGGIVNIGGSPLHVLTTIFASSLNVTGEPGVRATTTLQLPTSPALQVPPNGGADIADAETFFLGNGTQFRSFEFDSDGVFVDADGDLAPDNILITFTGTETRTAMAVAVSNAINLAGLGFVSMEVGNGVIDLGAPSNGIVGPLTNTSLTRADRVATSLMDSDVFSIDDGSKTVFFEFDDSSLGNGVTPGYESILFTPGSAVDTVADTMVAVIASAGVNLAPVNQGDGAVELNDSPGHLVDVTASSLTTSGVPGGGVLVKIRSDFSDAQVADSIVKSINTATTALPFENVTAQIRGGSTLFVDIDQFKVDNQGNVTVAPADYVDGSAAVTGISNFFLSAVKDLPGNSLEANQSTDETQFTILLPGTELDFGDAPDPFTGIGRYATLFDNDGARHVITETPIFLGSGVDADADGQPSLTADGDDADHVLDISASNLSVTGTAPYSIVVPAAGGAAINDGEEFTIERFNGQTVTFEFDENGVSADTKKINFTAATTRDELANAIVAAIQADTPQNNSNHDLLVLHPANLGNGIVFIGGELRHAVDASQSSIVVEGTPASVLRIPATAMGTANMGDGDLIVFHDGAGSVTFEFDSDATVVTGNTAVTFVDTETPSELAMNLIAAVQSSGLQFAAPNGSMTHQGSGVIQVAGPASHDLDISQSPSLAPAGRIPLLVDTPATGLAIKVPAILQLEVSVGLAPTDIQDGDMFIINDRINPAVTFEFDDLMGGVAVGSYPISFTNNQAPEVVASQMVAVIQQAVDAGLLVGIQPVHISGGLVDLQPVAIVSVDSTQSQLVQTGPVAESQTFSIDLDGPSGISPSVVFEFTKTGNVSGTNRPVQIQDVQSADDVAKSIVTAIKNAALSGNPAGVVTNNLGDGVVDVSGPTSLVVDLTNSPDLSQDGVAGGLADGQLFTIGDGMRQVIFEFDRNDRTATGNLAVSTVTKDGTESSSEWAERTSEEIGAEIARVVNGAGLAIFAANLGGGSVQLQRDDEDGVRFDSIFTPNAATPITVTASADGRLNAWFDWNQDGDWNDPNEQVFTDQAVQAGANSLSIMVPDFAPAPSTLPLGLTAARFRFSSEAGLLPTGLAVDGEVEDYRIRVISNNAPTVVPPGIPNVPVDVFFPVLEDDADHTFDASAFFSDIDITNGNGDFLIFTVVGNTNPSLVEASVDLDGRTVVLDYLDDQNGSAIIRMRATDEGGLFVEDEFEVTVDPVNDRPIAHAQTVTLTEITTEDVTKGTFTPTTVTLTWDDGDPMPDENQLPSFEIVDSSGDNGTIVLAPDFITSGQFTYLPDPDFNTAGGRTATVLFRVTDEDNPPENAGLPTNQTSLVAAVTFVITPVNGQPVGDPLSVTTAEEIPINIMLSGSDGDPHPDEVQQITYAIVDQPADGTLAGFNPLTGAVTYTPNTNFNGADTFTFSITDDDFFGLGTTRVSDPTTFTINVTPTNDPPIANNLAFSVDENSSYDSTDPGNESLPGDDGDPVVVQLLTYEILTPPAHGTLTGFDAATGDFTYTPDVDYNNSPVGVPDTFTYKVTDDALAGPIFSLESGVGTVSITVSATNEKPIAFDQTVVMDEDEPSIGERTITLNADDNDPDVSQVLTYSIVTLPVNGTITNFNPATGSLVYTPDPNFNGSDTFEFHARDDALAGNPPNLFSDPATVTIDVTPVNDVPIAFDQSFNLYEDEPNTGLRTITLEGDDGDPLQGEDQSPLTFIVGSPSNGTLAATATPGQYRYTPNDDFNGQDSFTFQVEDDNTLGGPAKTSLPGTVNITVNAVNDAPQFTEGPNVTVIEDVGPHTVIGWASGVRPGPITAVDETPQIITFDVTNNNNLLFAEQPAISGSGTLTFTPRADANGTAVVTLKAQDNGSGTAPNVNESGSRQFTITVDAINDAPQFSIVTGNVEFAEEDAGRPNVVLRATNILPGPNTATDEIGQNLTFNLSVVTTGNLDFTDPPAIDSQTGELTYTTKPNTNGVATVTVTLSDDGNSIPPHVNDVNVSPPQTFRIEVEAVNDAPEFTVDVPNVEADEDAGFQTVAGWASDILPGPVTATDESSQIITFEITNLILSGGLSFASVPAVNPANGNLTFETDPDRHGTATVTVVAVDNGNSTPPNNNDVNVSAPKTFVITIAAVNDAPEFTLSEISPIVEDAGPQTVPGFVKGIRPGPDTATDEAIQTVTFNVTNDQTNLFSVQPTVFPDGTLIYTTLPDANGTAVVTVQAVDSGPSAAPNVNHSTKSFTLTIEAINDAPIITVPSEQVVDEDTNLEVRNITVTDVDAGEIEVKFRVNNGTLNVNTLVSGGLQSSDVSDNGTATVTVRSTPAAIAATLGATDGLNYQGNQDFNGNDVLTVIADDLGNTGSPGKKTDQATIPITVSPVNDAPFVANPIADIPALEDSPNLRIELFPRVFNDPDVATNNDTLTLSVFSNNNSALVSAAIDVIDKTALILALVPNASGQAEITIQATDSRGESETDTFILTVTPVNDAPVANPDSDLVVKNTPTELDVLSNDTDVESSAGTNDDIDVTTVEITSGANNASLSVNNDGTILFIPSPNFLGVSTFRYRVSDHQGALSNEATVTVRVIAPPTANDDMATTGELEPVAIDVLLNDFDPDGSINAASVVVQSGPSNGSVVVDSVTGVITYTPQQNFNGTDVFLYTVDDFDGATSNVATVTVTVEPIRHWQNPGTAFPRNELDVNADGVITPQDVLIVINALNQGLGGALPTPTANFRPPPFYDTNGDGFLTANDALIIINFLNDNVFFVGEGEGSVSRDVAGLVGGQGEAAAGNPFAVTAAPGFFEIRLPEQEAQGVEASLRGDNETRKSVDRIMAKVDDALAPVAPRVKKSATVPRTGVRLEDTLDEIAGDLVDGFYDRGANDSVFGEDLI